MIATIQINRSINSMIPCVKTSIRLATLFALATYFGWSQANAFKILNKDETAQNEIIFTFSRDEIREDTIVIPKNGTDFVWVETGQREQISSKSIHTSGDMIKVVLMDKLHDAVKSIRIHSQQSWKTPIDKKGKGKKPSGYFYQSPTGTLSLHAFQENQEASNKWVWNYTPSRPGTYQAWVVTNSIEAEGKASFYYETNKPMVTKLTKFNQVHNASLYLGKLTIEKGKTRKFGLEFSNSKKLPRINDPKPGDNQSSLSVILIPTSEGVLPEQKIPGSEITLHSKNSTLQSTKLQYEPQPHKITNGFWVNVKDSFYWDFKVISPGEYVVEIHQGCGKGHGGSDAVVQCHGQSFPFVVEDTGHFQNFIPRELGILKFSKPGIYRLWVKAVKKAKAAVMDVRQLKLKPKL